MMQLRVRANKLRTMCNIEVGLAFGFIHDKSRTGLADVDGT